jgi:hypothetical protein
MSLPSVLARDSVEIGGVKVEFRAMSRTEAFKMQSFGLKRADEAEVYVLTCGTGCTKVEAEAFRAGNTLDDAGLLIDAILALSGLTPEPDEEANAPNG